MSDLWVADVLNVALRMAMRFQQVGNRFPRQVADAYGGDLAAAAADSYDQGGGASGSGGLPPRNDHAELSPAERAASRAHLGGEARMTAPSRVSISITLAAMAEMLRRADHGAQALATCPGVRASLPHAMTCHTARARSARPSELSGTCVARDLVMAL
jgi:hypothetical protein